MTNPTSNVLEKTDHSISNEGQPNPEQHRRFQDGITMPAPNAQIALICTMTIRVEGDANYQLYDQVAMMCLELNAPIPDPPTPTDGYRMVPIVDGTGSFLCEDLRPAVIEIVPFAPSNNNKIVSFRKKKIADPYTGLFEWDAMPTIRVKIYRQPNS